MSQCFRPVKEVWNLHSSCFVGPTALITLLHDLAARVSTASDEHNYGDNTAYGSTKVTKYWTISKPIDASMPKASRTAWKNKEWLST